MKLDVRSVNFSLTEPISHYIDQKLAASVGRFFDRIRVVTIHLQNQAGPRGGADHRCQVCIQLVNGAQFCVRDEEPDLYNAISVALSRSKRALIRRVERKRDRHRHAA